MNMSIVGQPEPEFVPPRIPTRDEWLAMHDALDAVIDVMAAATTEDGGMTVALYNRAGKKIQTLVRSMYVAEGRDWDTFSSLDLDERLERYRARRRRRTAPSILADPDCLTTSCAFAECIMPPTQSMTRRQGLVKISLCDQHFKYFMAQPVIGNSIKQSIVDGNVRLEKREAAQ